MFRCEPCNRSFGDWNALKQHKSMKHYYCIKCERDFKSENCLKQHFKSSAHQPLKVKCCADGCDVSFLSQGHLCLHLEGGRCPSGIARSTLNDKFRLYNEGSKFTVPYNELKEPARIQMPAKMYQKGNVYECPCCNATFNTDVGLRQHLDSPRHEAEMYRCPHNACKKRFTALSALFQHIESETCGKAHEFTRTIKALKGIVKDIMNLRLM